MKTSHRLFQKYAILALTGFILTLLLMIPVRLAIAFHQAPQPQAILMLGGTALGEREKFTAEFAQYFPSLDIWVSSGLPPNKARPIFQAAGIKDSRLHLDYRAVDTVTNFTSLIPDLHQSGIHHLFLITSDYHIPRAKAIATIVLGSQGIAFTPLSVPSRDPPEPQLHILRDSGRALLWVLTGYTGAKLKNTRVDSL